MESSELKRQTLPKDPCSQIGFFKGSYKGFYKAISV